MLTIRSEQMRVLTESHSAAFDRSLVLHVAQSFPDLAPKAETFVRMARAKAASYQLTGARDIRHFVDLCAVNGIDFDQEPANAWMRAALLDPAITNPSERLRVLLAKCQRRLSVIEHNARVKRPAPLELPGWLR